MQMPSRWFLSWAGGLEGSTDEESSQLLALPQVFSQEEPHREKNGQEVAASPGSGE